MANLVQVSSAFGKPMETIDTTNIVKACYARMQELHQEQGISADARGAPDDGRPRATPSPATSTSPRPRAAWRPDSQLDLLRQALAEGWPAEQLFAALDQQLLDRRA